MAAVHAAVGMVALAIMVGTLLRKRSRLAWAILLGALVVGGSLDVVMNGPAGLLYRHTSPPNPIPGANVLWAYFGGVGGGVADLVETDIRYRVAVARDEVF